MHKESSQSLGRSLTAFASTLLDHVANDVKTPSEKVQSAHAAWVSDKMVQQENEDYLQRRYDEKHAGPRRDASAAYDEHKQQQQLLRHQYIASKRHDELYVWLSNKMDNRHYQGLMDNIYTKYVHDL